MSERSKGPFDLIGSVAKKAKDAVMIPVHGAFALAKAVAGGEDRRESREEPPRPRGDRPTTDTRPSDEVTDGSDEGPTSPPSGGDVDEPTGAEAESSAAGTPAAEATDEEGDEESDAELVDIWGVGDSRADDLREAGFESVRDVAEADVDGLDAISGIGESTAEKMIASAEDLLEK